jgi:hypothetical protein
MPKTFTVYLVSAFLLLLNTVGAQGDENANIHASLYDFMSSLINAPPLNHADVERVFHIHLEQYGSLPSVNYFRSDGFAFADAKVTGILFVEPVPERASRGVGHLRIAFDTDVCVPRSEVFLRLGPLEDSSLGGGDIVYFNKKQRWGDFLVGFRAQTRDCLSIITFLLKQN